MNEGLFKLYKKTYHMLTGKGLGRIPGAGALRRLSYRFFRPRGVFLVNVRGNRMYIDSSDEEGVSYALMLRGKYEEYETELLEGLLRPGMVVVDIGANIGYYSLVAAKLVKATGRIYAFEPDPRNFHILRRNIAINDYKNVSPFQLAVLDKGGNTTFFMDKRNFGRSSIVIENIESGKGAVQVPATSMDEFFAGVAHDQRVDLIKIDAQGAEGLILRGAKELVGKNPDINILMEFWPYGLRNVGTDPLEVLEIINDYGFRMKCIDEDGRRTFNVDEEFILDSCGKDRSGKGFANLLLERERGFRAAAPVPEQSPAEVHAVLNRR